MDSKRSFSNFNDESKDKKQQDCLHELEFYSFLEGQLTVEKRQAILSHLNSCEKCVSTLVSLGKLRPYSFHHSDTKTYRDKKSLSREQQVDLILKYIESDQQQSANQTISHKTVLQPSEPAPQRLTPKHFQWKKWLSRNFSLGEALFTKFPVIKVQTAALLTVVAFMALLFVSGVFFVNNYLPVLQFNKAMNEVGIYYKFGKLSGNFSLRRSPQTLKPTVDKNIVKAQIYAQKMIESQNISPAFLHSYFQLLIIQSDFEAADSVLHGIQNNKKINASAELMNDFGVYYYLKELTEENRNFEKAENYFQKAKKVNPQFKDTYFNLALVRIEQNDRESAITLLDKFLEFETDTDWRLAAEDLKQN